MNGIWKENVNIWHKDYKRKKQNRKHILKDKAKSLIRRFYYNDIDNNSIRNECKKYYSVIKEVNKKSEDSSICRVEFKYYLNRELKSWQRDFFEPYKKFIRICYKLKNKWYDVYDNKEILFDEAKIIYKYEDIHIRYKEPIFKEEKISLKNCRTKEVFIYGKPLPTKYYNLLGFYSTGLRKYYKKLTSSKRRANTRNWINKKDYSMDLEIKMSALEKSYKWFID